MNSVVLDASALIAYLNEEPGADAVEQSLADGAAIGAVNWAEVLSKVSDTGIEPGLLISELTLQGILGQSLEVLPLVAEDSLCIAELRSVGRPLGLSLADRSCLALGMRLKLPVLTTDRIWKKIPMDIEIKVVR